MPTSNRISYLPHWKRSRHWYNVEALQLLSYSQWYHPWSGLYQTYFTLAVDDAVEKKLAYERFLAELFGFEVLVFFCHGLSLGYFMY
jgi:hypothetical protein